MKSLILIFGLLAMSLNTNQADDKDRELITQAVKTFSLSADKRDSDQMNKILHKDFRAIVNRLFGSDELSTMDKSTYLDLLKQGKIGGDQREVKIQSIHVEANNAVVHAKLHGKALLFETFIQLVKDVEGNWTVISDMPVISQL